MLQRSFLASLAAVSGGSTVALLLSLQSCGKIVVGVALGVWANLFCFSTTPVHGPFSVYGPKFIREIQPKMVMDHTLYYLFRPN